MTDIIIEHRGNAKVLHLSGDLGIQQADRLGSRLVEAFGDTDRIEIDVSSVTTVDISCLQLFCAAHKASIQQNKLLQFDGVCPDAVGQIARNAGFSRRGGCALDTDHACLWSGVTHV